MSSSPHRAAGIAALWLCSLALVLLTVGAQTAGLVLAAASAVSAFAFALTIDPLGDGPGPPDDGRDDGRGGDPGPDGPPTDWDAFDRERAAWDTGRVGSFR